MSRTVDQRVVEMQFDNRQFERNVSTTMSSLDKLKQSLNLTGASKGLEGVGAAAKGINFSGLTSAAETVGLKFNAMYTIADQALRNITNSAVNAGKRIVSALTIDPIKMGFSEYETQINAVQTIMANTSSKGTTLDQVNSALDTLNTYADKTIYNFTEMTRNIGTFTAAGVDLDTSVKSIQGIANLAAVSGSTSQQASTAMYQLSQALAAGKVQLMDWNSVVNAGMGGQVFQDALKETSRALADRATQLKKMSKAELDAYREAHGYSEEQIKSMKAYNYDVDGLIKKYGSFRESLSKGEWLTTDVLTETLEHFTMAAEEGSEEWNKFKQSLMDQGYTEKQAVDILKMANTATNAATKVKTLTQLWDTLKEAAQSGWTQSWEIIVGDFEEAKELFTKVSDVIGNMLNESAQARNEVLQGWKDMDGRTYMIGAISNAFAGLMNIIKPVGEAFKEVFPPITSKTLVNISKALLDLSAKFKVFTEHGDLSNFKSTIKGIFSIASLLGKAFGVVAKAVGALLMSDGMKSLVKLFFDITGAIGDFFTSLNEGFDSGGLSGGLSKLVTLISDLLGSATEGIRGFGDILVSAGKGIVNVAKVIWDAITKVFGWILDNVSAGDIFAGLTGSGIFVLATKLAGVFKTIKDAVDGLFGGGGKDDGGGLKEKFGDILDSVHDSLSAFTSGIKVWSLVGIAAAIGILSASLKSIAELDAVDIGKGLFSIAAMLTMLSVTFKSMMKTMSKFDSKGIVKSSFALILVAKALDILADAMVKLSDLSLGEIGKGLIGVGGGMLVLSGGLKILNKVKVPLSTSVAMLALAQSCKVMGDALQKFGQMKLDEIGRGLTAMGGALGELVATMAILSKVGGGKSLAGSFSILIVVQSLSKMADGLKKFGEMQWDEIERGLAGMGGALAELVIALAALGRIAGFSSIFAAGSILIVTQGLDEIAAALKDIGSMSWDEIEKGVVGMCDALAALALANGALGIIAGFSSLFAAGSILIVTQGLDEIATALKDIGSMTWDEIDKGVAGMCDALAAISLANGSLGIIAGFSSLFAAGSILLTIQGLGDLADSLKKFGEMTWDQIDRGLVAMFDSLGIVALMSGALGAVAGLPAILGGGAILLAVQGLGDIADALKKFGEMSWDEIDRGITAMAAALGELALGGLLNTLSIIGAYSISEVAEPLGVLADSVKKWAGVTVPEGLGWQLAMLADGVFAFTFGGLGASAISELAAPLGTLADSVMKWSGVTIPEGLPDQLGYLAVGVGAFTFNGLGAAAISGVAEPLGELATSVSKWSNVSIPENLKDRLTQIADGVKAFSWAFMGGWSLDTIIEPLGALPESLKKWNGVDIPEGLNDDLTALSDAVKDFSWAFMGGWSLSSITGPLGDLAGSVKKWNGVTIPEGIGDDLKELASGVKAFGGASDISNATTGMKNIAEHAGKLAGINYATINSGVKTLAGALNSLSSVDTSNVSNFSAVSKAIDSVVTSLSKAKSKFSSAGSGLINSLSKGMTDKRPAVVAAITTLITAMQTTLNAKKIIFTTIGGDFSLALTKGISEKDKRVSSAISGVAANAVSSARGYYDEFYGAGAYVVSGFAAGISANSFAAAAQAAAMAAAALASAKAALRINSPSKEFMGIGTSVPEGFAMGIDKMSWMVTKSSVGMANTAIDGVSNAISKIGRAIDADIDTQPTIRPVLDLSDVRSGAGYIGSMLDVGSSIGVMSNVSSISAMMSRRGQSGTDDVVSAIDKLRKDISNVGGTSYQINGVTYDDGSNVRDAISEIVRYAKIERRV